MKIQGVSALTGVPSEITIDGGRLTGIAEISGEKGLPFISPGFFDIQVNGYMGSDYSLDHFTVEHIRHIISSLGTSGTTQHLPTIVTSPQRKIVRNLRIIAEAIENHPEIEAAIPGIHIEGPYISSEEGPRGAHDAEFIRDPEYSEFQEWQQASGDRISLVTLAPEKKGAMEYIERVSSEGVIAAIGHTSASPEVIRDAVRRGARLSTHIGNGSHLKVPRLENYIWEQLATDELMASLLTDRYHLPEAVVKVIYRTKGLERLILISDVTQTSGYDPGRYKWGNIAVRVREDGNMGVEGSQLLAGSIRLLDYQIACFMEYTGCNLASALAVCTTNPAGLLKLDPLYGKLDVGSPANVTLFRYDHGDRQLDILHTISAGREIFRSEPV